MGPRVVALVVVLAARAAAADTPEAAADAVLAAFRAGGDLRELAARDDPDPWLVADELCARGEHDAAEKFAKAAPRPDTEKLPTYVTSRRDKPVAGEARKVLGAIADALATKDFASALEAIESSPPPRDEDVAAARRDYGRGLALRGLGRHEEAALAFLAGARTAERIGWLLGAASALHRAGMSRCATYDFKGGLMAWEQRLRIEEIRADRAGIASVLGNIGTAHYHLGNQAVAFDFVERALKLHDELGDRAAVATTLGVAGAIQSNLADYAKALECQERALRLHEELGDRAGVARTLVNLGEDQRRLGNYTTALSFHERALPLLEELGDRGAVATTLDDLGLLHGCRGDYAKALWFHERALQLREQLVDPAGVASTLGSIGTIHWSLGDYAKALLVQQRSLALSEELGDTRGVARMVTNMGVVHHELGDHAKALSSHERALGLWEQLGERAGVAASLANIGATRTSLGDYAAALDCQGRALALLRELGDQYGVATTLCNIGLTHELLGEQEEALACCEDAAALATRLGAREIEFQVLWQAASVHLTRGNARDAARSAREAVAKLGPLVGKLADESGAAARQRRVGVFGIGASAGVSLGDEAEVSFFLESGRAMTLVESLGGRQRIHDAVVPGELRGAEAGARAAEVAALMRYRRSMEDGGDAEALWRHVEGARGEVLEVARRIQREAKAQASLVYPEAAPLERIRATLGKDETLVTYALLPDDAIALVVTREAARTVPLGKSEVITKAAATLQAAVLRPDERGVATPPHERLDFVARRLRALVIEPLGLKNTKRLLVAPGAELAYVPFALLAPEVEVAYIPSGTTYGVLLDDAALRGEGVLALGDPPAGDAQAAAVYRGGEELAPLPASRAEAQAVGDVVLVGKDATESGFLKAAGSRPRWRAVHFACHGLVRADIPELSCLALGADSENDGFLTVLEVFRLKIPSDLVVLSACETAKGKVYRAEGVIGLARAFMLAGSPRVICSLWKVDDTATRELMTTFYKEWKPASAEASAGRPGVGAAEALRKAQQHVAAQERWKDPYFWAAWQLWGLPQ